MKHIFAEDIKCFEEERQKIKDVFDSLDNQIAKNADDAIGEMLDEFFSDTNVNIFFDGEKLEVSIANGGYQISLSWNEAINFLLEDDDDADDCEKIAQIFQTTAAQFLEKAAKSKQASD